MKKWCFFLIVLLLLTGCGKQDIPASPYALEVEYGDSGVPAMLGGYSWRSQSGGAETKELDPLEILSDIPYVNETGAKKINLLFDDDPDSLQISWRSSADGYKALTAMEKSKTSFAAPTDGASYLYLVEAQWNGKDGMGGACRYWFRYLPAEATGDQSQEMSLYRLVKLEAKDLFGVEFHNNLDGLRKTCTAEADRAAILDYLKEHLATNFVRIEMPEEEADYVLRLAVTQGEQLTLGYGGEGQGAWIMLGGVPYEAEVMDLYSLWEGLETESVAMEVSELTDQYLAVSETDPVAEVEGAALHLGLLQSMDAEQVIIRAMTWIDDENEPNGYRLEEGDLYTYALSPDCQFWILDGHNGPWGQVTGEALQQWQQESGYPLLFQLQELNGEILRIYEKFVP